MAAPYPPLPVGAHKGRFFSDTMPTLVPFSLFDRERGRKTYPRTPSGRGEGQEEPWRALAVPRLPR
jgi:hypothetical protein